MTRSNLFLIVFLLMPVFGFSQTENAPTVDQFFPPPPNAASLGKFGELPVDEFKGTANVSIPLHTIQEGDLSLPISLNYHTGGIKVAEVSSWVGLGWALSAGGTITRKVNGTIDEGGYDFYSNESEGWYELGNTDAERKDELLAMFLETCGSGMSQAEKLELNQLRHRLTTGTSDSKPDIFYLNVPGYTGKFYFNDQQEIILDPYDKIAIDVEYVSALPSGDYSKFSYFTVVLPNGTKYYFGGTPAAGQITSALDRSRSHGVGADPLAGDEIVNSWHLVKMESVNGDYVINFNYDKHTFNDISRNGRSTYCEGDGFNPISYQASESPCSQFTRTLTEEARLSSIQSTHCDITFSTKNEPREDFSYDPFFAQYDFFPDYGKPKLLDKIDIKVNGQCYKQFEFGMGYFGKNQVDNSVQNLLSSCSMGIPQTFHLERPRLNNLVQKSCGNEPDLTHSFGYYTKNLPSRLSYKQDMWGYFCNNPGINLLPDLTKVNAAVVQDDPSFSVLGGPWDQETEDRNPSMFSPRALALNIIKYPTGARTEISYEENKVVKSNFNHLGTQTIQEVSNAGNECPNDTKLSLLNISLNDLIVANGNVHEFYELNARLAHTTNSGCTSNTADYLLGNLKITQQVGGQEITVFSESLKFENEVNSELNFGLSLGLDLPFSSILKSACWWEEGQSYNVYLSKGFDDSDTGLSFYPLEMSLSLKRKAVSEATGAVPLLVGGIRIDKITEVDGDNTYVTDYDYTDPMGVESGVVIDFPKFVNKVTWANDHECDQLIPYHERHLPLPGPCLSEPSKLASHLFRSAPVFLLSTASGHTIGYKYVKKIRTGGPDVGHSASEFNVSCISRNSHLAPKSWLVDLAEIPIFPVESRMLGKVERQAHYAAGASDPISSVDFEYEELVIEDYENMCFSQYSPVFRCPGNTGLAFKYKENIPNRYVRLKSKSESLDGLETITEYSYRSDLDHIQPIEIKVKRDGNVMQTTSNYFPQDIVDHPDPDLPSWLMNEMLERNMHNVQVKTESYGLETKGSKNVMQIQNGTDRILPYRTVGLERSEWIEQSRLYYNDSDQFPDQLVSKFYQNDIDLNWNTPFSSNNGGLLESQTILNQTTSFIYNGSRLLSRRTNLDNTSNAYQYDGFFRLEKMTERGAEGGTKSEVTNTYNIDFNGADNYILNEVSFPDGKSLDTKQYFRPSGLPSSIEKLGYGPNGEDIVTESFTYDEYKRLESKDNYQTGTTTLAYYPDPLNRISSETYNDGASSQMEYGSDGTLHAYTVNTDENGNTSRTFTDLLGRTISSARAIEGDFATTQYEYFDFGGIEQVTTPMGKTYDYTYDDRGRMKTKKIPGQGITSFEYDNYYRLDFSIDPNGIKQDFSYDSYNRPIKTYVDGTLVSENFYDKQTTGIYNGKLWKSTETILNETGYGGNLNTEYTFDEFGRSTLDKIDNHVGGQDLIYNTYDFADNILTSYKTHSGFESLNFNTTYQYDHSFRLTDEYIQVDTEPQVHITENTYNSKDQLARMDIRGSVGSVLQHVDYQYNSRGWLTHINDVNEQGFPLVKCDDRNPPCDPCDPDATFRLSETLGAQTEFVVLDLHGGGGQSLPLNYPYRETELASLKADLESWLQSNAYPYQSVLANWSNGELTLEIEDSEFEFNSLHIATATNGKHAIYFGLDNAQDYINSSDGYCSLCHQFGYDCAACPIWEILTTCNSCPQVNFTGTESKSCESCQALGELDCTTCDLGGYAVQPLSLQIALDPNALIANADHLIGFEASALVLLEEGYSVAYKPSGNTVIGDPMLAQKHSNPLTLDISFSHIMIAKDNHADVEDVLEQKILSELQATFEDLGLLSSIGTTKLPELSEGITLRLMESLAPLAKDGFDTLNPPTSTNSPIVDLFGMVLDYQQGHPLSGAPGQYNGNISGMTWQAPGERKQTYGITYDQMDRILRTKYYDWTIDGTWNQDQKFATSYSYDLDGNIMRLNRNGALDPCRSPDRTPAEGYNYGGIDNLYYIYNSQNQLNIVAEASSTQRGFKNTSQYSYDGAGNLITDSGKGLTAAYNFLNLPGSLTFASGAMKFQYTPSGQKLQKNIVGGPAPETIDYVGNIEYKDGEIAAIHHSQGRLIPNPRGRDPYRYQFHLKDHLGNIRVLFEDINKSGTISTSGKAIFGPITYIADLDEVLGIYHYYPFGMKHDGVWTDEPWENDSKGRKYDYQYNGKELNEEFGLEWNDHGWRWYDASVGRFTTVDPLAEIAPDLTPYRFGFNNPILFVDLDGLFESKAAAKEYASANGIYLGLFSRSKIKKNKDADGNISYSIDNSKEGTSTTDVGGEIGVITSEVIVKANDVMNVAYDEPNQGKLNAFLWGPNTDRTETLRDGSEMRHQTTSFHIDSPIGPGGAARGVKTFADVIKGLKGVSTKHGTKFVRSGIKEVAKIYKSLRQNGFKLTNRGKDVRILENAKTGEKIIFRKSKTGGYNKFDSMTQSRGGGKNNTVHFQ